MHTTTNGRRGTSREHHMNSFLLLRMMSKSVRLIESVAFVRISSTRWRITALHRRNTPSQVRKLAPLLCWHQGRAEHLWTPLR